MKTSLILLLSGSLFCSWAADTDSGSTQYRIKVADSNGRPIAGAVVERYRAPNWMSLPDKLPSVEARLTTGADGTASFSLTNRAELVLLVTKSGLSAGWSMIPFGSGEDHQDIEITLTAPAFLSGKVQDANGKAIADAQVWASYAARPGGERVGATFETLSSWFGRQLFSVRSGPDGGFQLTGLPTDASLELTAAKGGYAPDQADPGYVNPASLTYQAGQSNVVLTMRRGGGIEGTVVEEGSATPIAHARILPSWAWYGNHQSVAGPTGPDGRFAMHDLSPGEHTLRTLVGTNQFADWICEDVNVAVEAGVTNRGVRITASRGAVLEVAVREETSGAPLADANVNVSRESMGSMAKTAADGVARLRLAPGEYYVHAAKERYKGDNNQAALEPGKTNRITFSLKTSPKLLGRVLDPDGKPAPNTIVTLFPVRGFQKQTDTQGRFALTSDQAQYYGGMEEQRLVIARDLQRNLAAAVELDDEATNAEVRLQPALVLAGQVTDPKGNAITNAEAQLLFWTERTGAPLDRPAKVDAQGRFEIKALPQGRRYNVSVSAKGFGREDRSLQADESAKARVQLDSFQLPVADQRIAGVVVDSEDKPVADAWVNTYGDKQPNLQRRADPKGRFTFEQVCAGPIRLSANNRHGAFGSTMAEAGDTNITLQLGQNSGVGGTAAKLIKISGKVLDADGKPVPRALVWLFPYHDAQKRTDSDGNYSVTANPNQWGGSQDFGRTLIARDLGRNLAVALDVDADTTNADLQLEPAVTVSGRLMDAAGKPLTNGQAQLIVQGERIGVSLNAPARPGSDGRFEFKALPVGRRYSVSASAPGYGQENRRAEPTDAQNRNLELEPFQLIVADQPIAGVVVDSDDKPVPNAWMYSYGEKQPNVNGRTDRKGRFAFKVCPGPLQLSASSDRGGYGNARVEGGDTNIVIRIGTSGGMRAESPPTVSLKGKPLPALPAAGLAPGDCPAGQSVLVLLVDAEQRPSRRALRVVGEKAALLKDRNLSVLIIQAGSMSSEAFEDWKKSAGIAFPVGCFKENVEKQRAAWGATALPWLILTDKEHKVVEEGFPLEDLEAKIQLAPK